MSIQGMFGAGLGSAGVKDNSSATFFLLPFRLHGICSLFSSVDTILLLGAWHPCKRGRLPGIPLFSSRSWHLTWEGRRRVCLCFCRVCLLSTAPSIVPPVILSRQAKRGFFSATDSFTSLVSDASRLNTCPNSCQGFCRRAHAEWLRTEGVWRHLAQRRGITPHKMMRLNSSSVNLQVLWVKCC